jgi:hypothetical protein
MMTTIFFMLLVIYITIEPLNASFIGRRIRRVPKVKSEDMFQRFEREYSKEKAIVTRNLEDMSITVSRSIVRGSIEMAQDFVITSLVFIPRNSRSLRWDLLLDCWSYGLLLSYTCIVGLVWHIGSIKTGLRSWFQKALRVSLRYRGRWTCLSSYYCYAVVCEGCWNLHLFIQCMSI